MNVLFLCTGNSCRSLIDEAAFNHLAPEEWHAISAGSQTLGWLNSRVVASLEEKAFRQQAISANPGMICR